MPVKLVPYTEVNPLRLPNQVIIMQDQPTIRQIVSLAGFADTLKLPPPVQAELLEVRFEYGLHYVLLVRQIQPGQEDYLHAVLIPKSEGQELADTLFAVFLSDFGSEMGAGDFDMPGVEPWKS